MPPKWTRKISRANPGAYYWNTNNIRGSYVPEPPGVEWDEANAQREWNAKMIKNAKNSVFLKKDAFTPRARKWKEFVFGSPRIVDPTPLPPSTNPLTLAGIRAAEAAQRAPDPNYLRDLERIGIDFMKGKNPKTNFTRAMAGNIPKLIGTIVKATRGLKEPLGGGLRFDRYFDVLKRDSGVSNAIKAQFIRHILLLNRLLDGKISLEYGGGMFRSSKKILDGFSPGEIAQLKEAAERVLAFARDENSELYILEEYRIEAAERGASNADIQAYMARTVAAAAAPPAAAPPSAAALEAARIEAARQKLIANAQEHAEQEFAASAGLFNDNNAPKAAARRPSLDATSDASSEANSELDEVEENLRAATEAVRAAEVKERAAKTPGEKARAAAKLKAARAVEAKAREALLAASSSELSVETLSNASSVAPRSSASSVASNSSSSNSGSPLRVAKTAKQRRGLGFAALPHLRDGSNTEEGAPVNSAAAAAAAAAVDPRAGVRFLLEQQAKARALKEALAGAKAVVNSSVDPALDAARAAAKLPPGAGAERAARANLERKEKARQAKLEEEERLARIFGLKPRKPKKGASKGGSRRKRRGNKRVTKRR